MGNTIVDVVGEVLQCKQMDPNIRLLCKSCRGRYRTIVTDKQSETYVERVQGLCLDCEKEERIVYDDDDYKIVDVEDVDGIDDRDPDIMYNSKIIMIPVTVEEYNFEEEFSVQIEYSSSITIEDILNKAIEIIKKKHSPILYHFAVIDRESFIGSTIYYNTHEWNHILSKPITKYKMNDILQQGLYLTATVKYNARNNTLKKNFSKMRKK